MTLHELFERVALVEYAGDASTGLLT